jgi:glycosyltransferase involved in cell wall biosynthesis
MVLFLHNRYRTTGGEERVVEDLMWLVQTQLGRDAHLLARDSASLAAAPLGRARAAVALLRGGLGPDEVAAAVRRTGARIVHAHNLNPSLGWRSLAAARSAGARVILHLHNYRLVCAVGTCFTRGADCTRCHGRNTAPGVALNCRGTGLEAAVYGASLSLWQRRVLEQADVVIVPSRFAHRRLVALGAPLQAERVRVMAHPVREFADRSRADAGIHALVSARLAPEKGIDVAVQACLEAGIPLVVTGDGPLHHELARTAQVSRSPQAPVRLLGRVGPDELRDLRARAAVAVVPSRSAETYGLAAAEAMAAGVPTVASRVGALPELVPDEALVPPGDPAALATAISRFRNDREAGERGLAIARSRAAPEVVAPALEALYAELERRD